jgi:hypothetical protein
MKQLAIIFIDERIWESTIDNEGIYLGQTFRTFNGILIASMCRNVVTPGTMRLGHRKRGRSEKTARVKHCPKEDF